MFYAELENTEEFAGRWVRVRALVRSGMRRGVQQGVEEGAADARSQHRFSNRTGTLEKSIVGRVTANRTNVGATKEVSKSSRTQLEPNDGAHFGVIEATAKYASFVEEGTRPHTIEARSGGMLHWLGRDGNSYFARKVKHPGTRSLPFMSIAYLKCERVMLREIQRGVDLAQVELDR